jgi:tetratricopeptide (TPR) repeat protein
MSSPLTAAPPRRPGRRIRLLLLPVVLLGLTGVALAGWWYYTTRPEYVFRRGREAVRREDWQRLDACVERLEAAGEADRAAFLRGTALVERRRFPAALAFLNRVRGESSLRVEAATLSGRCLLELGELREAYRVFSWVLEQDPDEVEAHRGMGAIAWDLGNLTRVLYHMEQVARLDEHDGRPFRLIGLCHGYMGQDDEAESTYREALARDLSGAFRRQVQMELAECLVRKTRWAEALAALDERLASGMTEDLPSLALRGECLWGLGQVPEAREVVDRALEDYPRNPHLLRLRGQIYLADQQRAKALEVLERAVRLSPGEYRCRYQLARAYRAADRPEDAAKQEKKADQLHQVLDQLASLSREAMRKPWDPDIRIKLAGLCEKVDNPKLARMWYQAAEACFQNQQKEQP